MKAIIPVAGAGTHLRPHTYTQPKALIPVAGKPILAFIIDQLIDAGIRDFVFIIGYFGEKIRDYVTAKYPDITSHFVHQHNREGLGHAIWLAHEVVPDDEEILIMLGDTIVEANLSALIHSTYSAFGIKKVNDPRQFGVAEFDEEGFIKRVVEKPRIPKSNMALIGVYKIKETRLLFQCLEQIVQQNLRTQGEIQLTDAFEMMIQQGVKIRGFTVENWYDCGKREILLETNAKLLKKSGFASENLPDFHNTIVIHPVNIAEGTRIENSIVGPNVTIGEGSDITYSIIRNSIIGNYARLEEVTLHSSIIGSDVSIKGLSQSLNIGDNTEIDLSGMGT